MPPKGRITVDEAICKGCGLCVASCPQKVLALAPTRLNAKGYHPAEQVSEGCTACTICGTICPETAITVFRFKREAVV